MGNSDSVSKVALTMPLFINTRTRFETYSKTFQIDFVRKQQFEVQVDI